MCRRLFCLIGLISLVALVPALAGAKTLLDYDFSNGSGTTVTDLSGSGNHGTLAGFTDTTAEAGVFGVSEGWVAGGGLCLIDDGVRSYVDTPLGLNALPGDFTLEFEASYAGASGWAPVIGSNALGCCAESVFFGVHSGQNDIEVRVQNSGGPVGPNPWVSPPDATRHHVALVYEAATDGVEVFVDGVSIGAGARAADMASASTQFRIGNTGWSAGEQWGGVIYGVAVSNEKLAPGSFIIPNRPVSEASEPSPGDGATDVPRDSLLSWMPGKFADTHDIYLGTSVDAVGDADRSNQLDVLVRQGQNESVFDAGLLAFGKTYYWRVDEVSADGTIFKGEVWSFRVEPYVYALEAEHITATASSVQQPDMGPENTINGSGLDADDLHSTSEADMWLSSDAGPQPTWIQYEFDTVYKLYEMWVWNYNVTFESVLGFGFKDVTIEYSADGTDWQTLDGVGEFAQGTGEGGYAHNAVVDFDGATARYVKLTANSSFQGLGQYGLSEVRFLYVPVRAREPQPAAGQVEVDPAVVLSWRAGREAASHELHLSDDRDAVENGTALVDTLSQNSYDAGALDLQLGQTYYWKIVEVNDAETPDRWDSEVWSFSTMESFVVDDFEGYDDDYESYNRIFQVWIDGAGYSQPEPGNPGNGSGSLVGTNQAPWVELTVVHVGHQAMPISYDNTAAPFYSEAVRTFAVPQDWTRGSADTLTLYFRGNDQPANGADPMYVVLEDSAGRETRVQHTDENALSATRWREWAIPLSEFSELDLANIVRMTIGVGNRTSPQPGSSGMLYIDDIRVGTPKKQKCLFISESSTAVPDPKDEILINYLKARYAVDIATGDDVKGHLYSVDDFKQYDFLFVSESVSSSDTKDLKGAPVPVFYTELWASKWDVTGWVPTNESPTYYGNTTVDETVVRIVDGAHPLAAGFATGAEITLVTDSENATDYLTYSVPQVDHIAIATLAADETKVVVMGVEAGTALYNEQNVNDGSLVTASRCAAVGINANANAFLTEDAFKLIQAGIHWILGEAVQKKCLFVSESKIAVPDPKDEILIDYLKDRYVVDIATGDDVKGHVYSVDDFKAYDFVFVSESVSSSDTKDLKGAPVPVLYTELWASKWDVTGWVPTNESPTYYGNTTVDETVVKIVDGAHPLAAGFATGTEITMVTDSENAIDYLTYSVPQVDYVPIATLVADETKVVVFGVGAGTVLYNAQNVKDGSLVSAARCAGVGINANANNFLTDDAFKLIQAGIDWILAE